jgi:RecA/RadA recombinase
MAEEKQKTENKNAKQEPTKTKKEIEESIEADLLSELQNDIQADIEEYTKDLVQKSKPIEYFDTGIDLLNAMYDGGFPVGKIHQFVGNTGSFKSTLAGTIAGGFQNYYKKKGELYYVYYLDSENTTTEKRLAQLGVRNPKVTPFNIREVENIFQVISRVSDFKAEKIKLLEEKMTALRKKGQKKEILAQIDAHKELVEKVERMQFLVIWDSLANTITKKDVEAKGDYDRTIGKKQKLLAHLLPLYVDELSKHNITMIIINQLRDDISMDMFNQKAANLKFLQKDKVVPGGTAVTYNSASLLDLKVSSMLKEDEYGFSGLKVYINAAKNKFYTPNLNLPFVIKYTTGVSNFWTNWMMMDENTATINGKPTKLLKTGAYNSIGEYRKKFRKKEAEGLYRTDPEFKEEFDKCAKLVIDEWIEKNRMADDEEIV